jgi:hypothetical protein
MPRLTAQDFDQELLILFDAYVHGDLDRRGFLERAQRFARAGITAAGLLASLSPDSGRTSRPAERRGRRPRRSVKPNNRTQRTQKLRRGRRKSFKGLLLRPLRNLRVLCVRWLAV